MLREMVEKKIRQNERFEGEGDYRLHGETARVGEKEGEGKALTSCGNTYFSHELIQTRKVIYSIPKTHGEKGSSQCVHRLKRATRDSSLQLGNLKTIHTAAENYLNWFD